MIHCLQCGYDLRGLDAQNPCPKCGAQYDEQRRKCMELATRPLSLAGRFVLLRRLPPGWWEAFDDDRSTAGLRSSAGWALMGSALLLLAGLWLGTQVWIEHSGDIVYSPINTTTNLPTYTHGSWRSALFLTPIASKAGNEAVAWDLSENLSYNPAEYQRRSVVTSRRLGFGPHDLAYAPLESIIVMTLIMVALWWWFPQLCRLNVTRSLRIAEQDACAAALRAADVATMIPLAHALVLLAIQIAGYAVVSNVVSDGAATNVMSLCSISLFLAIVLFPLLAWSRAISADRSRRVFGNHWIRVIGLFAMVLGIVLVLVVIGRVAFSSLMYMDRFYRFIGRWI